MVIHSPNAVTATAEPGWSQELHADLLRGWPECSQLCHCLLTIRWTGVGIWNGKQSCNSNLEARSSSSALTALLNPHSSLSSPSLRPRGISLSPSHSSECLGYAILAWMSALCLLGWYFKYALLRPINVGHEKCLPQPFSLESPAMCGDLTALHATSY